MKSKFTLIIITCLLLVGCNDGFSREEILLNKYEVAYNALVSSDKFDEKSEYYNIEIEVYELSDGTYRVDAILDSVNVAMYNVQMMMEVDSKGIEQYDYMIPSLGIVDDTQYNLIPNQVNDDNGFYAGLILSAINNKDNGNVKLMISWSNYANTKQFVEYIEVDYDAKDVAEEIIEVEENENDE